MKVKKIVNITSGLRHQINLQKNLLSKYNNIIKKLIIKNNSSGGRNNYGRITVRHKGAGCKKNSHIFSQKKIYFSILLNTMYNPIGNSFASLYFDLKRNSFFKTIAVKNIYCGCLIESNIKLKEFKLGYRSNIINLPTGSIINSVFTNSKVIYSKSAGTFCQIIEKKKNKTKIKVPSGKFIILNKESYAVLGIADNSILKSTQIGKAGRNRLKGIRPSVRGIAMNPVDHPHGGKSNKGICPVTPWGIPTKNKPTVKK